MWSQSDWGRLSLDGAGTAANYSVLQVLADYDSITGEETGDGGQLTVDDATGIITIGDRPEDEGWYLILFSGAFISATSADTLDVYLRKGSTAIASGQRTLTSLTAQMTQHIMIAVAVRCAPSAELSVWLAASAADTWQPSDLSFYVVKIA